MNVLSNKTINTLFNAQRVFQTGLTKSGMLSCVKSALIQLAIVKQCRATHSICASCHKAKLLLAANSSVPRRYRRQLYPMIVDYSQIDDLQPQENFKLQLDYTPVLGNKGPELLDKIENVCVSQDLGRLFAVVYINKEQRKITAEDLLVINGFFPPQIGDRIRLEKYHYWYPQIDGMVSHLPCVVNKESQVLMVGSKDFTLTGTPLLSKDLVKIEATVVEKTLSNIRVHYEKRKKWQRFKLLQNPQTMIVINSIEVDPFALRNQQTQSLRDSSQG